MAAGKLTLERRSAQNKLKWSIKLNKFRGGMLQKEENLIQIKIRRGEAIRNLKVT